LFAKFKYFSSKIKISHYISKILYIKNFIYQKFHITYQKFYISKILYIKNFTLHIKNFIYQKFYISNLLYNKTIIQQFHYVFFPRRIKISPYNSSCFSKIFPSSDKNSREIKFRTMFSLSDIWENFTMFSGLLLFKKFIMFL